MYDNICKFLAEMFPEDFTTWLVGSPLQMVELSPRELSLEPIRADALILQQSDNLVLHVEFQTDPDIDLPFRMADYRLRVYRRYPQKEMRQIVIYLRKTNSEIIRKNAFILPRTRHEFDAIYLWEQPTNLFLNNLGLLPFAVLSQTTDPIGVLTQIANNIDAVQNPKSQNTLSASAAILAGLILEPSTITRILRRDIMRQSLMYQEILREGRNEGLQQGVQQGIQQGLQQGLQQGVDFGKQIVAQNLLRINMPIEQIALVTDLSVEQIRNLSSSNNNILGQQSNS